jgi:iron complex outermembrane receptor protein
MNSDKTPLVCPSLSRTPITTSFFLLRAQLLALAIGGFAPASGAAESSQPLNSATQLKQLSLEELMNLEVTTTARQPALLFTAPSAIQVITQEDIRRSGATRLPEALRLASNLQVAQVDSRQWAISARGFNNTLANKLLVMIDGRTVYTPLFAGVFWDVQDTLIEDIDRIEVVSGPGATLWGANAVNGVINIITKPANETQGTLLTAAGGSLLNGLGAARYGTKLAENTYVRVYGKYFDRGNTVLPSGGDATNDWRMGQGGLRLDWLPPQGDSFTLQADGYGGSFEQPAPGNTDVNGQNVLGRWRRPLAEGSDLTVQSYWDRTYRKTPQSFTEDLNTFDLDFQHRFPLGQRQEIIWGGGYRLMIDRVDNGPGLAFRPEDQDLQLVSGFVQDEFILVPERLRFTLGTKLEHNDYSGFEVQPSGRMTWTPEEHQTVWGAISRAVRSPSRVDRDLFFPATPPYAIAGGKDFDSEKLIAYELGYRWRPVDRLTLSLASFFDDYDDIRSISTNTFTIENANGAEIWGIEFSGGFEPLDWWRLRAGYTFLHKHTFISPGGSDINRGRAEGNDPEHQFVLQSMINLPYGLELDCVLRYVDNLPEPPVPAYFTADVRIGWRWRNNLEISVVGQNLCDPQHPEFGPPATRQEIPRSVYGKVTWQF